ncbi:carnitine/acyl carnitine carrier [Hygrophoropsis aurantiaca]|uniref:Carnitine/acyl carnitine carrier n=1 Tax=Hygrophoropsis aurantiaca TaxID=72124 RepID=A0ACB8ABQ4_9AGAM|nr:carnitine/acyl carnitine carrier [Hygrophoropsis aurantiaca]
MSVDLNPTVDFIAGTVSGIVSLLVTHPFDTVKVRFQNPDTSTKYRSTFHALATIAREERFRGLYKGATCALMNGLVFASYKFFTRIQLENENSIPTLAQVALAGTCCGVVSSILTTPTELIKIRQQNILSDTPRSTLGLALSIYRQYGVAGLYRGFGATVLRDTGYGVYFLTYEATCRFFATPVSQSNLAKPLSAAASDLNATHIPWPALLFAGAMAGVIGWLATFPFDVVKTRIQSCDYTPVEHRHTLPLRAPLIDTRNPAATEAITRYADNPYRTIFSTIVNSYRSEGPGVFFKGLAPTLIRAIPANIIIFPTYEYVVYLLSK